MAKIDQVLQQTRETHQELIRIRNLAITNLHRMGVSTDDAHAGMTVRQLINAMLLIERPKADASNIQYVQDLQLIQQAWVYAEEIESVLAEHTQSLRIMTPAYAYDGDRIEHDIKVTNPSYVDLLESVVGNALVSLEIDNSAYIQPCPEDFSWTRMACSASVDLQQQVDPAITSDMNLTVTATIILTP